MNRDTQGPNRTGNDAEIASRFARLRTTEADSAPPFTAQSMPPAGKNVFALTWPRQQALPRVAAALALVAVTFILFGEQPEQDPALVYAGIMNKQQIQTDILLEVSDSVLPAMATLPSLYEFDVEFDPETHSN
jgi:hypothetical protein